MDLENQAQSFSALNTYQVTWNEETGRWATVFPYGSALLLAPAYWAARLTDRLGWLQVNPEYFVGLQGRPFPYSLFVMLLVNLYALAAVALAYRCARFFVSPVPAAASALFLFLGTPALYYATVEPFMVHVPATLMATLAFYLLLRGRQEGQSDWWALAAGLAGGVATLVRWQMSLLVCALALCLPLRRRWRATLLFAGGFWAVAWHVLYTWGWMFGRPLFISAAQSGFIKMPVGVLNVLFSDERGLFIWSPLALLGLVGWGLLARQHKGLALGVGVAFVLQALLNGSVADWWGGWSFGMRRMTELYPILVVGLAVLLNSKRPERRPSRFCLPSVWSKEKARPQSKGAWVAGPLWALAVLFLCFSLLLLLSHLNFINTVQDRPQGDRATTEIQHQLVQSNFHITWQVFLQHYGPWAWRRPGP
jgi:hypothetical protein